MTTIFFTVSGLPKPAGSKRGFAIKKGGAYTGKVAVIDACKGSRDWKHDVKQAALTYIKGADFAPLTCPIEVDFVFIMPRPKCHYGTGKNESNLKSSAPFFPAGKPDVLKLSRGVEDALTGIIWKDDSQIVTEKLTKRYGAMPGVAIKISEAL